MGSVFSHSVYIATVLGYYEKQWVSWIGNEVCFAFKVRLKRLLEISVCVEKEWCDVSLAVLNQL